MEQELESLLFSAESLSSGNVIVIQISLSSTTLSNGNK
jgi:hypothetical protein